MTKEKLKVMLNLKPVYMCASVRRIKWPGSNQNQVSKRITKSKPGKPEVLNAISSHENMCYGPIKNLTRFKAGRPF